MKSLFVPFFLFFLSIVVQVGTVSAKGIEEDIQRILLSEKNDSIKIQELLGLSKVFDGQPLDGLMAARSALFLAEKNNFLRLEGKANEFISLCRRDLGDYSEAIKASIEALKIYDQLNLLHKTAALQLQIGSHFTAEKNYSKAIPYISQALNTFQQRKDTANVVLAMINLGETYRLDGNVDSAALLFQECLELNQMLDNPNVEVVKGYARGNLGMVYATQDKEKEAIELLKSAMEMLGGMNDYYSASVYQAELAQIYIRQGQKEQGEELLRDALQTAEREKLKEQIRDISKDLSRLYEETERFRDALELRKQYEVYHDSLVNIENVRKTEQLESQYWLDRKDANIRILELENQNKRRTVIVLALGALILLGLLFFVYRLQILRKQAFKKVAEQKDLIERREQEKALLLKELNHRVKNNLQMVSSMFSLQASHFRGLPAADALLSARRRIDALMLIHQKLYHENVDTHINLNDYIKELTDNLLFSFDKKADCKLDLSAVLIDIDSAIPLGIVINELLTNSLKYGAKDEKLAIYISLHQKEESLVLVIADNGPGFPGELDLKKSKSLGLKLVRSLIRQLQGGISQTNDEGCRWEIKLNIKKLDKHSDES